MNMTPEPFLSAEISYRQQRIADSYARATSRRHWVPKRPHLELPRRRHRAAVVA